VVEQWTGCETREMAKIFLPIVAKDHRVHKHLAEIIRPLLDFSYTTQAACLMEKEVGKMDKALATIHCPKLVLVRTGIYQGLFDWITYRSSTWSPTIQTRSESWAPPTVTAPRHQSTCTLFTSNKAGKCRTNGTQCCKQLNSVSSWRRYEYIKLTLVRAAVSASGHVKHQRWLRWWMTMIVLGFLRMDELGSQHGKGELGNRHNSGNEDKWEDDEDDDIEDADNEEEEEGDRKRKGYSASEIEHPHPEIALALQPTRGVTCQGLIDKYGATNLVWVLKVILGPRAHSQRLFFVPSDLTKLS
jgi:hypothetical protein